MKPTINIITAVFNGSLTIADCLRSINAQTVPVENILIDGVSCDNTLDIVRKIRLETRIISEPDQGIYDAMNKGLQLANGDVIGILNADDWYADDMVLERVGKVFEDPSVDACYGDLVYVTGKGSDGNWAIGNGAYNAGSARRQAGGVLGGGGPTSGSNYAEMGVGPNTLLPVDSASNVKVLRYWKSGPFTPDKFKWGWMPPHPTFFVRRRTYEKYGLFNLDLGSAADYELMLRFLLKHRIKVAYIPEVLVCMRAGGVSNASLKNRLKANRMDRKAWEVNRIKPYPWTLWMKPIRKVPQYFLRPKRFSE